MPRFSRVLLINPIYQSQYGATLPTGLGYIAEALDTAGIDSKVKDMGLGYSNKDLLRTVYQFQPDLIGVSMMTDKYKATYEMISLVRQEYGSAKIVVGGPHVSNFRKQVLRECASIDFGIVYEGEHSIVELCRGKQLMGISGLLYRNKHGEVSYVTGAGFIQDLDSIPFPRYKYFELEKYPSQVIPIVSSRGCPYACVFCNVNISMGKKVRIRSPKNVVDQLEYWYARGRKRFNFQDDNFTFYRDRVVDICQEILNRKLAGLNLLLGNGIRADGVDEELLRLMKEAGFSYVAFGVEGGNDRILKNIKKGERIAHIEKAIEAACKVGLDVKLFFLVGSPGETWADFQDSLELARKYPVSDVFFNNLIPYPRTELFEWVDKNNYFVMQAMEYLNTVPYYSDIPVFESPEFSVEQRKKALRLGAEVRRRIRRKYYAGQLRNYSILGRAIAWLFVSDFVQKKLLPNTRIGKLFRFVAAKLAPN